MRPYFLPRLLQILCLALLHPIRDFETDMNSKTLQGLALTALAVVVGFYLVNKTPVGQYVK